MNTQMVKCLYAHNGDNKMITCQVFSDSYRFTDFRMNGVNTGIIESKTPLESAYAHAKENNWNITDLYNGGHSG
jgi:hypothetical protein